MSEYWKSTPSYWCKFCSQYVRDTAIERKNHESSARHQSNIQRSLRELHKGKEREERDKQRAKDEVSRLNGLVGAQSATATTTSSSTGASSKPVSASKDVSRTSKPAPPSTTKTTAQQRIAHAEQLAAMGVELPEELKKAITGVGSYEVVNAHEVNVTPSDAVTVHRSLAEILAEARQEQTGAKADTKVEEDAAAPSKSGVKRKVDEDEDDDPRDEETAPRMRKTWGSTVKTYPGNTEEVDNGDLDALLGGVKKKAVKAEDDDEIKQESGLQDKSLDTIPDVKENGVAAAPPVMFKKRKGKK